MSLITSIHDECCLLTDINLNPKRVYHLLERRFKNNSTKTSFDFKCFLPEQPSNNVKVSRSLLRCQPKIVHISRYEDNLSSDEASSSEEEEHDELLPTDNNEGENDRLKILSEWDSADVRSTTQDDDDDDDDDDDEDEDENENIFQSIIAENDEEDNSTNPMDFSPAGDTPMSPTEDLLVTYSHKPIKTEPISYDDDDVFDNPPQLDGHFDDIPPKSNSDTEKHLAATIARITANQSTPNRAIEIHQIPPTPNKFRLNDGFKKKPTNQTLKSSSSKVDRPKEKLKKDSKSKKETQPRLLSSVLKKNGEIIRPLQTPIGPIAQKTCRLQSDSRLPPTNSKLQVPRKSLSIDERKTSEQQKSLPLIFNKQKSLPQNLRTTVKPKEKSASDHMAIAAKKLKHQQSKPTSSGIINPTKLKAKDKLKSLPKIPKSKDSNINTIKSTSKSIPRVNTPLIQKKNKLKSLDNQPSAKSSKIIESFSKTTKPSLTHQQPKPSINPTTSDDQPAQRPTDLFEDCIILSDDDDDDDIQEIEREHYSIAYNIRSREKLLDHIVHCSAMHIKWLFNLDYVLLEHISICHENNIRPLNNQYLQSSSNSSIYQIDPSFISSITINFLKLFILRNSANDQQNVSFLQFGLTSHLRYLLIELPTYNHNEDKDLSDYCSKCHCYSLIINILFDLLFDLIEHDLCQIASKAKYRSSLIEDDYFARFSQTNSNDNDSFYRIKILIYFIELIGIHMTKCSNKNRFQFNKNESKLFHSIEDFIRIILSNIHDSFNQRIALCFNVMELCLLFVNEKDIRIKQMSLFLAELCENNPEHLKLFLFEKNLLPDIRLLLINEIISKKFHSKLSSIGHLQQFFNQIQENFNSTNSIDGFVLLLLRSLFNTYADLILELKEYSEVIQTMKMLLHNQLKLIFDKLIEISYKGPEYFQQVKSTLFLYRLLKCKWNKL